MKNIRSKMKVVYDSKKKSLNKQEASTVMICYTTNKLQNEIGSEIQFNDKILGIVTRCTNIYGSRTMSFCSHGITALHVMHSIIMNKEFKDPTPLITKRMQGITNIAPFIQKWQTRSVEEREKILQELYDNRIDYFDDPDQKTDQVNTTEIFHEPDPNDFGIPLFD